MLGLLWQGLGLARADAVADSQGDLLHAALHWEGVSHQHDDDGGYAADVSGEAVLHVMQDQGAQQLALNGDSSGTVLPLPGAERSPWQAPANPPPRPERLLRPPRRLS